MLAAIMLVVPMVPLAPADASGPHAARAPASLASPDLPGPRSSDVLPRELANHPEAAEDLRERLAHPALDAPPRLPTLPTWEGAPVPPGPVGPAHVEERDPHPPIRIVGDEGPTGFVLGWTPDGEPVHRPGSGVVAGTGTADDPFVIEGWELERIVLRNTTAHAVVRDVHVRTDVEEDPFQVRSLGADGTRSAPGVGDGVVVLGSTNVTVEGSRIAQAQTGVFIQGSEDIALRSNRVLGHGIEGVLVEASEDVTIQGNDLVENARWTAKLGDGAIERDVASLAVEDSSHVALEGNEVLGASSAPGILVEDGRDVTVDGNTVDVERVGLEVRGFQDVVITGNDLESRYAMELLDVEGGEVSGNLINATTLGIFLERTTGVRIAANDLGSMHWANIALLYSPDNVVEDHVFDEADGEPDLWLSSSSRTLLEDNAFSSDAIRVQRHYWDDDPASEPYHQVDAGGNTVAGDPLVYVWNATNPSFPADVGWLMVANSSDVHIEGVGFEHARSVRFQGVDGLVLRDADLRNLSTTLEIDRTHGVRIRNVTIGAPQWIDIDFGGDVVVEDSRFIEGRYYGLSVWHTDGPINVRGNEFEGAGGWGGLYLGHPTDVTLRDNAFRSTGLFVWGDEPAEHDLDIDTSNTVDGRPILHRFGLQDAVVDGDWGQVMLANVTNVTVRDQDLRDTVVNLAVFGGEDVRVVDNRIRGGFQAIRLDDVEGALVARNDIAEGPTGVILFDDRSVTVRDNVMEAPRDGMYTSGGFQVTFTQNVVTNATGEGVDTYHPGPLEVSNNTFRGYGGQGVDLYYGNGVRILDNVLGPPADDAGWGPALDSFGNAFEAHGNNIEGHGVGAYVRYTTADATNNWWGCPDGPDDPACADARGDVEYDPWLTSPNPEAGAE